MQNKNYLIGGLCCLLAAGGFMAYQGGAMNNGPVSFLTQSVDEDPQTLEIFSKLNELQGEEREVLEKELREKYGEKFDEIVKISGEQSKESIIKYTCSEGACIAKPGGQYISSNCNNMCGSTTSSTTSNTTAGSTTNGGGSSGGGPSTTSSNSSTSNSTTSSSAGSSSSSNTTSINTSAGSTSVGSTNNGGTVGGGVVGGVDMNGTTTSANTPLIKYLCNGTTKLLEKHVDQPGWPVDGSCSSNMDLRHVCSSTDPNLAGTVCNNGNNVDPNPTNNCSLHHYRCETNGLVAEVNSSTIGFGNCSSTMQIGDLCSSFDPNIGGMICKPTPPLTTPTCGDGIPEGNEECDDGNNNNLDLCDQSCKLNSGKIGCEIESVAASPYFTDLQNINVAINKSINIGLNWIKKTSYTYGYAYGTPACPNNNLPTAGGGGTTGSPINGYGPSNEINGSRCINSITYKGSYNGKEFICKKDITIRYCKDNVVDTDKGEQCDDGNFNNNDSCNNNCKRNSTTSGGFSSSGTTGGGTSSTTSS